jgi:SAM-dependent methyltransferase
MPNPASTTDPQERSPRAPAGPGTMLDSLLGLLQLPHLYVLSQRLFGGAAVRRDCLEALDPRSGQRLLDVGCGPAYYLPWIAPGVDYYGFDTEARYIAWARARFGARGTFFCEAFAEKHLETLPRFDKVLLLGLLHHLDDRDADTLLDLVARALGPGGRVVTLDTCFDARLSPLARWIARHDRGRHVRSGEAFAAMAERRFLRVDARLVGEDQPLGVGLWRMTLGEPRPAASSHASGS